MKILIAFVILLGNSLITQAQTELSVTGSSPEKYAPIEKPLFYQTASSVDPLIMLYTSGKKEGNSNIITPDTIQAEKGLVFAPYIGFSMVSEAKAGVMVQVSDRIIGEAFYGGLIYNFTKEKSDAKLNVYGAGVSYLIPGKNDIALSFIAAYKQSTSTYDLNQKSTYSSILLSPNIGYMPFSESSADKKLVMMVRAGFYIRYSKGDQDNRYSLSMINSRYFIGYLAPNIDLNIAYKF